MRRLQLWAAGCALAILIPLLTIHAPAARADEKNCAGTDASTTIVACSAILDAGTEAAESIAAAYLTRANAYYSRGQYDAAIKDYDRSIALDPKAETYYMRGNAYYGKGNRDQAIKDHARAIALKSKGADAYRSPSNSYSASSFPHST
jgi:tetratricopeptide (TPR) repeat protein